MEKRYLPVLSITANLHPFVKPGSRANTIFSFIGGVNNNDSKFDEKFSIAFISAFSVKSLRISLSIEGCINLL